MQTGINAWLKLKKINETNPFHLIMGTGDQLYNGACPTCRHTPPIPPHCREVCTQTAAAACRQRVARGRVQAVGGD